jgi:hypothetical protein
MGDAQARIDAAAAATEQVAAELEGLSKKIPH